MAQEREHLTHLHAGLAVRRQRSDFHVRVAGDQPDQFGAGISGRSKNGDFMGHIRPLFSEWQVWVAHHEFNKG